MMHQLHLSWTPPLPSISPPLPSSLKTHPPTSRPHIKARVSLTPSSSSSPPPPFEFQILSNAARRRLHPTWTAAGFTLGVDLGNARTGLALSKGFSPRPLTVLELRGQKLELRLLEIAEEEEVDEFVIGLPISHDGKETTQSNKIRSIAGRFAVRAADKGLRVYLQDEHGTSMEALDFMIEMGVKKSARQGSIDAYSAMMVLNSYFSMSGHGAELVLPKQPELQEKLLKGPDRELDF